MVQGQTHCTVMALNLEWHRNGIHSELWVLFLLLPLYKLEVEHPLADDF